jgi:hypothetical protein
MRQSTVILPIAALIALTGEPVHGQAPAQQPPRAKDKAPRPGAAPAVRPANPLIPEGSELTSVIGYFARSLRDPGLLVFRIEEPSRGSMQRTLVAMPCDPVDDVRALLDDPRTDTPFRFEVTGTVYAYERRSFVLPVAIVPLRMTPPPGMLARIAPKELEPPARAQDGPFPPRLDAWASLEADPLLASPVAEVAAGRMAHEPDPSSFPSLDDGLAERLERQLDAGIEAADVGTAPTRAPERFDRAMLLSPGTRFQDRRASILRDPITGAWRARFDTGRAGDGQHDGAEASVELLPSATLESLARSVKQMPVGSSWLLSGEVVVSRERSYLLLTRAVPNPMHRFMSP